jgi:hypothetical protein
MFCPQCGKPVLDGASFCNHCGSSLAARTSGAAQATPAVAASGAGTAAGGSSAAPGASAGGLIARIRNILLSPATEWPVVASEPSSPGALYLGYVAPLVAIGVAATFIGQTMVGLPLVGRVGVGAALAHAVIAYVLSFLGVFLIAMIVDLLAPSFGGQRDSLAALKVTVYSFTPGWLAGIFNVIPMLGVLGIIGALYGLYLLYLGLPVLMRCPADKSIGYTVVTVICAIVTWVVVAALTTCAVGGLGLVGLGAMSRMGAQSDSTTSAAAVVSSLLGGKTDADRARVNEAMQTLKSLGEQAEKSRSTAATRPGEDKPIDANAAIGAVGQIMSGGKEVQPVDFRRLKDMLPEALPGMQRVSASGQGGEAMGLKGSSATARYSDGRDASITIAIADMASLSGLTALASRFDPNVEKETDTGYERVRRVDGQLVHERYDRKTRSGELSIILAERFAVTVEGHGVPAEALGSALKRIDVTRLASAGR